MARDAIASRHQQFIPPVALVWRRCGEGFQGFIARVRRPRHSPEFLAGVRVERQQIRFVRSIPPTASATGFVALQHWKIKTSVVEDGAGAEGPVEGKLSIVLLNISFPDFLALEIQTEQIPGTKEKPDVSAVRDGGR